MDFDKIRPAVEEIALDDIQKAKILNSCKNKKRKFNYKPVVGIVASAAVITLVLASPGFLFRASEADESSEDFFADRAENEIFYADDEDAVNINTSLSLTSSDYPLFVAEDYCDIYAVIPSEFSSLVNEDEYNIWAKSIDASGGMAMMQFIEHFNIPREDFENANSLYAERTFAYLTDSAVRFDADVIYSGNREAIDSFYKK